MIQGVWRHTGLQPDQERDGEGDEGVGPGGASAAPQMCVKKDEKAFMGFFDKHIYLPLPEYASRLERLVSCFVPAFVFVTCCA